MGYQKVYASCWYRKYKLTYLSHPQWYSLILAQPLDHSHFGVIISRCYSAHLVISFFSSKNSKIILACCIKFVPLSRKKKIYDVFSLFFVFLGYFKRKMHIFFLLKIVPLKFVNFPPHMLLVFSLFKFYVAKDWLLFHLPSLSGGTYLFPLF